MTKLEKLYSIIENSREVGVKLSNDVLKAIRNMEPAWLKVNGSNFRLVDYKDPKGELRPCYQLTKTGNNGDWYLFHSIKGWGGLIHF